MSLFILNLFGGYLSPITTVTTDVLQGLTLGPLPFSVFINYTRRDLVSNYDLFADDMKDFRVSEK